MDSIKKESIKVLGLNITYYETGTGEPLLLLHGGRLSALSFRKAILGLSKNYRVIAPDIPGHGQSSTPKELWSYVDYANFLGVFLKELNIDKAIAVGYSMGGGIAINLAANSSAVKKLVLVDSSGIKNVDGLSESSRQLARLKFYLLRPKYYSVLIMLIREYLSFLFKHSLDFRHMSAIRRQCQAVDYTKSIKKIKAPTLILWGEEDIDLPLANANALQAMIKSSRLVTVHGNHDWPLYNYLQLVKRVL